MLTPSRIRIVIRWHCDKVARCSDMSEVVVKQTQLSSDTRARLRTERSTPARPPAAHWPALHLGPALYTCWGSGRETHDYLSSRAICCVWPLRTHCSVAICLTDAPLPRFHTDDIANRQPAPPTHPTAAALPAAAADNELPL